MRSLGGAVDDVFTARNRETARAYERDLKSVDRTAIRTLGNLRREWRATEREVLSSVAKQEAEIGSLEASLKTLGATDSRPNINLRGFSEAMAQLDLLEARLRALGAANARPGVSIPTSRFSPGGGGGGFGRGGLRVPFAGSVPWPLVGGALAATPPLLGAATGLLGTAGSATLGLGALGLTGGGVGTVAGGLALPSSIAAIKGISGASKALEKYQEEVIQSGPNSEAARQAFRELNMELRDAPRGTRRFLAARQQLGREFGEATRPGQAAIAAMGTRGINFGRQITPLAGRLSNRFLGEARVQTDNFADFLNDPRSRDFYRAMAAEATADLSSVEGISENVLATMMSISRAGRPFFHEGIEFLEDWTGGWRASTNDIRDTREEIGEFVDHLRTWKDLTSATFDLTGSLLDASSRPGQSMVDDLTAQLREWDRWVEQNPREVRAFFRDAVDSTERIATGVGNIVDLLWQLGRQLEPLLTQGADLVTLLGNAGLLTPGGLPLLIGAGAGLRGAFGRGPGGAGGVGGGGVVPPVGVGGGLGGSGRGGRPSFGRVFDAYRNPPMVYGYGGPGREGSSSWSRQSRGRSAWGAARREFGPMAGRFGSGFVRGFGPYAAFGFGLGMLGTQGDFGERLQAGVSSVTLGAIPQPTLGPERAEAASREAMELQASLAERYGGGVGGLGRQIRSVRRTRGALADAGMRDESFEALGGLLDVLRGEREEARTRHSASALGDITGAFDIRVRHGADQEEAFGRSVRSIERQASKMHGRTSREFSQMGLDWARSLARNNPKLRSSVNELAESIEKRFGRMGENVKVIHGRIVDVSSRSWGNVRELISSQTQRAYAEANKNLTALEQRAFAILRGMGYSKAESRNIVYEAQHGHPSKAGGQASAQAFHHGKPAPPTAESVGAGRNATGGGLRLPMPRTGTLHDVVNLGGGNVAAGGELVIGPNVANRHTERRIDQMLLRAGYNTTLAREIGREGRAHSEPFSGPFRENRAATGSIMAAARLAQRFGLNVGEGPGFGGIPTGGHASGSLHYSGLAYDVSGSAEAMRRYFFAALKNFRGSINELFYDPIGWYIDNGRRVSGAIGGHSDHVHIGFMPGGAAVRGGMRGAGMRGGIGAGVPSINLPARSSGIGGLPGAAADRSNAMTAAGMSRNLNRLIGAAGQGGGRRAASTAGGLDAWLTRALKITGHYSPENLRLLRGRAMQESGGNPRAVNNWDSNAAAGHPSKGLLQTIPETFATYREPGLAGGIFNPVANAAAAINYMFDRYGHIVGPSSTGYALGGPIRRPGFAGWFAKGGHFRVKNPTIFGAGERGEEDVHIIPRGRRGGGGGRPVSVTVKTGPITVGNADDAHRVGRKLADGVAERLADLLESSDGVAEKELTG